ncbi:MAG: hypothetical protein HC915_18595 [Anaerolineae bacterium]|nr:hypothetical protein [Anaerolineae bacterium]
MSLALTYRLGRELFSPRAALAAGLLLLSNDLVNSLGPVIRHYSPAMLLALLSTWFYWRWGGRWSARWGAAYALSGLLLIYTLYNGVLVLLVHGLHSLLVRRRLWPIAGRRYSLRWLPALAAQVTHPAHRRAPDGGRRLCGQPPFGPRRAGRLFFPDRG